MAGAGSRKSLAEEDVEATRAAGDHHARVLHCAADLEEIAEHRGLHYLVRGLAVDELMLTLRHLRHRDACEGTQQSTKRSGHVIGVRLLHRHLLVGLEKAEADLAMLEAKRTEMGPVVVELPAALPRVYRTQARRLADSLSHEVALGRASLALRDLIRR